jgi:hypothetical protein
MLDITVTGTLPDQSLTDSQILAKYGTFKNYYRLSALYWARYFNKLPTNDHDKTQIGVGTSLIAQIQDNYRYVHGIQQNTTFAYLEQALVNDMVEDLPTPYMPGQDIASILLFLQGQFLSVASSATPNISVMNPEMKNKINTQIKMVEVVRKFKQQIEAMNKASGLEFVSPAEPQANTDEVLKTIYRSFATGLQEDADKLLSYIKTSGMSIQDYMRACMDVNVGRRCVLYVNDEAQIENVPPWAYGYVTAKDDDFGRYDVSRMKIQYISKDVALSKYDKWLSDDDKYMIRNGSFVASPFFGQLAAMFNYNLFGGTQDFMSELEIFWIATLDTGYKVIKTEDGGKKVYRIKKGSGKKGVPVQVIKRAVLLSNMFVVNYGIYDLIEDPSSDGRKLFPIVHFQPNTFMGINQSLVDRTKAKQKELDAINYKVREFYTQDLGTILAFNGKKFKDGMTPDEIYSQLRRTRITVSTSSGEPGDPTDREPIMDRQDVSLMRDIQNYLRIKQELKADIKEIMNVSPAIMGTPTEYIGLKTQQNSAALASNSVQYTMTGTIQLFADAAAIGIEKLKNIITRDPENPKWQNLLGEDGVERLLAIKNDPYTKFLLSVNTKDVIDPMVRAKILQMMEVFANSGAIDPVDYLETLTAKTISQLKDFMNYSVKKKEHRQQVAAMIAQATNAERSQIAGEAQMAAKETELQGQVAKQQEANEGKAMVEMIRQGMIPPDALNQVASGSEQEMEQPTMPMEGMPGGMPMEGQFPPGGMM